MSPRRTRRTLAAAALALFVGTATRAETPAPAAAPAPATPSVPAAATAVQEVRVVVDGGYYLSLPTVKAGAPIRFVFLKKDYSGCTKEVVFPSLGIRRALPTGTEVLIEVPAQEAGSLAFQCGMAMQKASVDVQAAGPRP